MKYRNKPTTFEAVQWTGYNENEIRDFVGADNVQFRYKILEGYSVVETDERPKCEDELCTVHAIVRTTYDGWTTAKQGDFIVMNESGEHSVVKRMIFERDFEKVEQ